MALSLTSHEVLPLVSGKTPSDFYKAEWSPISPARNVIATIAKECRPSSLEVNNILEVRNASFSVKTKEGVKTILDDVSLSVSGGELFALMGPSGAGKTSMLELMTLELSSGNVGGRVSLNGKPMKIELLQAQAAYVEQFDNHWCFLTCRDILQFAAALYFPGEWEYQADRVGETMVKFGLLECADTKAGNAFIKGMSGGQKKRLSLGIALLKSPVLLFLDEPTSGLDAASTSSIIGHLLGVAKEANIISIATVHQPSTEVFMSFTRVMILANGRVAYSGPPANLAKYCDQISRPLPPHTNPADYFLQLVNSDFVGRKQVDKIVAAWGNRLVTVKEDNITYDKLPERKKPRVWRQNLTLLHRHGILSIRDPTLYMGRMLAFLLANSFIAFLYFNTRWRHEENIMSIWYLGGWFVSVPSVFAVVVVFATNSEFVMVKKEIKNGMCRTGSYLLANFLLQIPYMFLLSACCVVLPSLIGYRNVKTLHYLVAVLAIMLWAFECMAQVMGVILSNVLVGMLAQVGIWFIAFLFMGTFLKEEDILWPLNYIASLMPLKWTTQSMSYLEFHGETFEGAIEVPGGIPPYACPGLPAMLCFGRTGEEILLSLSYLYSNVVNGNPCWKNAGLVLLIGAAWKFAFILVVLARTKFSGGKPVCRNHGNDESESQEEDSDGTSVHSDTSP